MRLRVAPQPPLGWLETALKLAAIGVGVAALAHAGAGAPGGARLAQGDQVPLHAPCHTAASIAQWPGGGNRRSASPP